MHQLYHQTKEIVKFRKKQNVTGTKTTGTKRYKRYKLFTIKKNGKEDEYTIFQSNHELRNVIFGVNFG